MGGIFISYRRRDSGPYTGRLGDTLSRQVGEHQVFRDLATQITVPDTPFRDQQFDISATGKKTIRPDSASFQVT